MSDQVTVRKNTRGAWSVYLNNNFISNHATHTAARIAAKQVQRIAETDFDPFAAIYEQVEEQP